ncbi:MAG TPA: purine-nucleoside phosphorylase [Candidatus Krumholzibacteria bacterium]|nr:purine-nucleoside phosphorylase [Candidatus Krumholzibacteria bacterium]
MTPHLEAKSGDVADRVLLPGDPLRAQFIAETFLTDPVCYNRVRGMLGFTGTYKGKRVSVQGTGMGVPSISIYTEELMRFYGVKRAMRVGTCGSLQAHVPLRSVILAMSACTDSAVNRLRFGGRDYAPTADAELLFTAWEKAKALGLEVHAGPILTSDTFYDEAPDAWRLWAQYGVLAVEMESAALYTIAAKHQAQALTVLTVSDDLVHGKSTTAEERQLTFRAMMELALETI